MAELEKQRADEAVAAKVVQRWLLVLAAIIGVVAIIFAIRARSAAQEAEEQTALAIEETTKTAAEAAARATTEADLANVEATRGAEKIVTVQEQAAAQEKDRERLDKLLVSVELANSS